MNARRALLAIATLALLPLAFAGGVAASTPLAIRVETTLPLSATGSDAIFRVIATGDDASAATLDFSVEGAEITALTSLNDTAPGVAEGSVYVRRDTPGTATLAVLLGGEEVARATAEFVPGAPVMVSLHSEAGPDAAARTWRFTVLDASGAPVSSLHLGASGDAPNASVLTAPLPFGAYTVRPDLGRDTAASCAGAAFYAMTPAAGVPVDNTAVAATAAFTVRPCESVPSGRAVNAPAGEAEHGAGGQHLAPLPPATGNGQAERPVMPESHVRQLVALALVTAIATLLGTFLVRLLARMAPVKPKK